MKKTIRSFFPVLNTCTYLNTAYVGPLSTELFEFRNNLEKEYLKQGDKIKFDSEEKINNFRETVSKFINSSKKNTFCTSNFSTGYRYILDFLPKKINVLALKNDYNSLISGLRERDLSVDYISITSDFELQIENRLDEKKYSVLVLSIVQFLSGIKVDFSALREIKKKNPRLIIIGDSTQFIGSDFFDFNSSPFDVVIGSGYKWILAGFGNAYLAVSDRFLKITECSSNEIYEKVYAGHLNLLASASLDFAIKFLQNNDYNNLIKIKRDLGLFLKQELKQLNLLDPLVEIRKNHSSIYTIHGNEKLFKYLQNNGIRCALRGGGVRVAVHFYNEESDIDKLIKILKRLN